MSSRFLWRALGELHPPEMFSHMILLRKYFLVKTQITWPSEEDATLACGPLVLAQLHGVEEQLEMGDWTYVDTLGCDHFHKALRTRNQEHQLPKQAS